ncbi:MAG: sigma-70 family RNA polymerase sigma factor [Bdellovibrionales bacterium]|nr:sigma-70 family RNA polymerase sigma factor [Bdellovibrionales bacterium]
MRNELRTQELQESVNGQRDELITAHAPFVAQVAKSLIRQMGISYDVLDDFIGAGSLGLIIAADKYDETVSSNFRAYASVVIRSQIINYLRRAHLSSTQYKKRKEMGMPSHFSQKEVDNVCDNSPTPELQVQRKKMASLLKEAMSYLSNEEQKVLMHHYWKGGSLSELVQPGSQLPAISKRHKKALTSLRKKLAMKDIGATEWW